MYKMIHVKKWIISPTDCLYKVAGVGESPTSNCDSNCTGLVRIFPSTLTITDLIFPSLPAINSDTPAFSGKIQADDIEIDSRHIVYLRANYDGLV